MKVLVTHELFMPDFAGGGEKLAYEMARGLKRHGIGVHVLTTGDPKVKSYGGISTERMPISRYAMNLAALKIARAAKGYDIIQTMNYNAALPAWLAGKITGKPVVCLVTGVYGNRWMGMRGPVFGLASKWIEGLQLNHSFDRIIFLSDFSRKWAAEIGIAKHTAVINPGVEHTRFRPKKKEWHVLFMGRFARQKGVYDLIEAARLLPDIKFKLVGWGEEEKKLRKLATPNVEFYNYTFRSGKKFFDMYARSAVLCQPSLAESFGFTIVEAMASGCAIVSTVGLGYKGSVIKPHDPKGLANAISKMFNSKASTLRMGRENVRLAKKYNWDDFAEKLISIYEEVLNNKR